MQRVVDNNNKAPCGKKEQHLLFCPSGMFENFQTRLCTPLHKINFTASNTKTYKCSITTYFL